VNLTDIKPAEGARHSSKRLGRGHGSGRMKTSGRGQKGQKARTGGQVPAWFEGGQNRFSQRMPYLGGFKNPFRKEYTVVNLKDLAVFAKGAEVTLKTLAEKGLIRVGDAKGRLKVLGQGELKAALKVTANKVSASAREAIEKAGGSITLIEERTYPKKKKLARLKNGAEAAAKAPAKASADE
jgi:large subunit ribosomal protein L15